MRTKTYKNPVAQRVADTPFKPEQLGVLSQNQIGKVLDFNKQVKLVPYKQSNAFYTADTVKYVSLKQENVPTNLFNVNTNYNGATIKRNDCARIVRLNIRMEISVSAAGNAVLMPVHQWFKEIQIKNDANNVLQRIYPEQILFYLNQVPDGKERLRMKKEMNFGMNGESWYSDVAGLQLPASATQQFFTLHLPFDTLVQANVNAELFKGMLKFEFKGRDIRESGAGVISLDNMYFDIETEDPSSETQDIYNMIRVSNFSASFLQVDRFVRDPAVLSASNTINWTITSFPHGYIPFMLLMLKQGADNNPETNGMNLQQLYPLGLESKVHLISDRTALLDSTRELFADDMYRSAVKKYTNGDLMDNFPIYLIQFTKNITSSIEGTSVGYLDSTDSADNSYQFQITAKEGVAQVQTITTTSVPTAAGYYSLSYNGEKTARIAYNASVGSIKTALESLENFRREGLTVTVAGVITGGSLTLTFAKHNNPKYLVKFNGESLVDATPLPVNGNTVVTTKGYPGFTSGLSYYFELFVFSEAELNFQRGLFNTIAKQ